MVALKIPLGVYDGHRLPTQGPSRWQPPGEPETGLAGISARLIGAPSHRPGAILGRSIRRRSSRLRSRAWAVWAAHDGDVIGPAISAHHRFVMGVGGAACQHARFQASPTLRAEVDQRIGREAMRQQSRFGAAE
jgi:hypothetical protein